MLDYLEWKRSTTKNPATVKQYASWIRRFHAFTKKDGVDFTLDDVMRFRTFLRQNDHAPKNIQYGTQLIRDYISYQVTMHGLQFPLKLLRIPQERSKSHYPITHEEYIAMLDVLPINEPMGIQRRLMISLLWDTGMRGGELLNLKIEDLKERSALIHNEKNHRNRLISWSERTDKLLKFYLPFRKHLITSEDYLFVSFKWKPARKLTTRQLERIVMETKNKAGLENPIRPHSFRHGFVHRQLRNKQSITTIAQMLGHSNTLNVLAYAQLTGSEIREAWGLN